MGVEVVECEYCGGRWDTNKSRGCPGCGAPNAAPKKNPIVDIYASGIRLGVPMLPLHALIVGISGTGGDK